MNRKWQLLTLAASLVFGAHMLLIAQEAHTWAASKTGLMAMTGADFTVGGALLPKGLYQIRCDHSQPEHVLVFRKVIVDSRGGERVGDEVARVKCRMEDLAKKADKTTVASIADASGKQRVTEILVRGEKVRHLFD